MNSRPEDYAYAFLENHYSVFKELIEDLTGKVDYSNIIIGGTCALLLHGLYISRQPDDVDLIIYSPTREQREKLKSLVDADMTIDGPSMQDYPTSEVFFQFKKSFKFVKENLTINILLEHELERPSSLMSALIGYTNFMVNSISNIIDAKASYTFDRMRASDNDGPTRFARIKDCLDFIDLKNSNFNYQIDRAYF